jgi:glycosyltransferase involved in cell wall biosynthesis
MPRVYAAADLVVLPSFGPGESWGLVVNEALCSGKAVLVSTQVGCQRDLVFHGQNGLVFPAGDFAALTAALRQALDDPARLRVWGEEGRRLICSFGYEEATAGLQRALDRVLVRNRRA